MIMRTILIIAASLFITFSGFTDRSSAKPAATEQERDNQIRALVWKDGGAHPLSRSKSTIKLDSPYQILIGKDAIVYLENTNGTEQPTDIEAIITHPEIDAITVYRSINEGYVKFDDWGDVDSDQMLKDIKEGNEEANKERAKFGVSPLHVTGWKQRPTLNKEQKIVQWQIEAQSGEDHIVNAVVLVFGRFGYEKLIWAGDAKDNPDILLNAARSGFSFDQGASYADFRDGDKVAEYGVAALVASAVGAKVLAKFGFLAAAALLFKKAWVVVLIIPAMIWRGVKKLFARRSA